MNRLPRPALILTVTCLAGLAASTLAACGGGGAPLEAQLEEETQQSSVLGFPALATKNTTRVAGEDATSDAAAVAQAVYPSQAASQRPSAVTLVDTDSWHSGVAASVLMAPPIGAPVLIGDGGKVPAATQQALDTLRPHGARRADMVQAFVLGQAPEPSGLRSRRLNAVDPTLQAAQVDSLLQSINGQPTDSVMVASSEQAPFAMPAAAYAAKSGVPVLFVTRRSLPDVTRQAIRRHKRPSIYIIGPQSVIAASVERRLRRIGSVTRISGRTPVSNAIAFARYSNGSFGWGVNDPGHGISFANIDRPLDAAASAALGASGSYAPLLLLDAEDRLPAAVENYLRDIQPGYRFDPARGVYNHAWLLGDESAIDLKIQGQIDHLAEIVRIKQAGEAPGTGSGQSGSTGSEQSPSPSGTANGQDNAGGNQGGGSNP